VPYLKYLARFHGKLQGRPIAGFTWNTTGGFKAVFDGGESVTFSYNTCLDGWMTAVKGAPVKDYRKADVTEAFRNEVAEQTRDVRYSSGLPRGADYHVGHDWENGNAFKNILKDFVAEKSLDLESIAIDKRDMPDIDYKVPHIADAELAHSWREYHRSRAGGMRMERAEDNLKSKAVRAPLRQWPFLEPK
jgi:hypothetical protein